MPILFTRLDTGHFSSTSLAAGFDARLTRKPRLELARFKDHRNSVVNLANKVIGRGDHHCRMAGQEGWRGGQIMGSEPSDIGLGRSVHEAKACRGYAGVQADGAP